MSVSKRKRLRWTLVANIFSLYRDNSFPVELYEEYILISIRYLPIQKLTRFFQVKMLTVYLKPDNPIIISLII